MPLNLQDELLRRRRATDELLAGRTDNTSSARSSIEASRGQFFGGTVNPLMQEYGRTFNQAPTGIPSRLKMGQLGSELERTLAQNKFTSQRSTLDQVYATALARAERAGLEKKQAEEYARQVALEEMQRAASLANQQADFASNTRKMDVAQGYAEQGLALQTPDVDYQAALYRSLFGGAASIGSAYLMNRNNNNGTQTQTKSPSYYQMPSYQKSTSPDYSLRSETAFTPRDYRKY